MFDKSCLTQLLILVLHRLIICQNYMMFPSVLNPPYFEVVYYFIYGFRKVAVARYWMICLVLVFRK